MFNKSRAPILSINRSTLIAATPIFFLLLLALWTFLNASVSAVKADPSPTAAFAIVKRASANLREGPGTDYRILGRSLKGASLPVIGKFDDAIGQRWYKVYLKAFGEVWVSGTVVLISPANANIPTVGLTSVNTAEGPMPSPTAIYSESSSSSNSSNSQNNPPSNPNPAPQPPAPGPVTTPEVSG